MLLTQIYPVLIFCEIIVMIFDLIQCNGVFFSSVICLKMCIYVLYPM